MVGLQSGPRAGPHVTDAIGISEDAAGDVVALTALTCALADSADPVTVLGNFNYTINITNTGLTATAVLAVLNLDPRTTFVSGSGTGWTVNHVSGVVLASRASLATGAAPTITVTVTATTIGTMSASALVDAANSSGSVPDTETTTVTA